MEKRKPLETLSGVFLYIYYLAGGIGISRGILLCLQIDSTFLSTLVSIVVFCLFGLAYKKSIVDYVGDIQEQLKRSRHRTDTLETEIESTIVHRDFSNLLDIADQQWLASIQNQYWRPNPVILSDDYRSVCADSKKLDTVELEQETKMEKRIRAEYDQKIAQYGIPDPYTGKLFTSFSDFEDYGKRFYSEQNKATSIPNNQDSYLTENEPQRSNDDFPKVKETEKRKVFLFPVTAFGYALSVVLLLICIFMGYQYNNFIQETQHPSLENGTIQASNPQSAGNFVVLQSPTPQSTGNYVASANSDKFHSLNCGNAVNIQLENRVYYSSASQAVADGKTPCSVCKAK